MHSIQAPTKSNFEWKFLDLETGEGIHESLDGVEAIVHAATNPLKQNVDVECTSRLLKSSESQGIPHLIYPSIVGIESIPLSYYKNKRNAEQLIKDSFVPYTIQRMTQFHELVAGLLQTLFKFPITMMPGKLQFQSLDVKEAANRILTLYQNGPGGQVVDFTGPEVLILKEMYRSWKDVYPKKRLVVPFSAIPPPCRERL